MRSTKCSAVDTRRGVHSTIYFLLLTCLLTLLATPAIARAAPADFFDDADEYDVKARVARVSLIAGEVSLKRAGNNDWERVRLNFPLVEGDTISTDRESRAEIQIDARNFVRLGANSILRIVTLRDEGVALSVVEGTATIRLAKFDKDKEYFELDAPKTTLAAEKKGLYRVDVSREGRVRLSARDGGLARIYSETSGFALRDGRAAELLLEGANAGDWEFVVANADTWDSWVDERERYLAERLRYDTQYYDQYTWGAEDLDSYGNWAYSSEYGWLWRPHPGSISSYADWAPYRYGDWVWIPPYGWTWVGYEPWGWGPYHYGRWVYYNGYWAWCPRSHYYRNRGWWRPALVAFFYSDYNNNYCWYPLNYHQRDPRSRHYPRYDPNADRLRPLRGNDLANLRRVNPAQLRAVTALGARDFGAAGARARPADAALARQVANGEPVRGDLPVRPANAPSDRMGGGGRAGSATAARPARVDPGPDFPQRAERPTGAAVRSPGVALDEELRRSRVLNGREARPSRADLPAASGGVGAVETRPTGAVERPARAGGDSERRDDPSRMPVRNPATEESTPVDRPDRTERPAETDRNERPDRPVRAEPREQPGRVESRETPPVRYDPPKRAEPPPRSDPPPQRYEPPPRNDPPPQRYEPPPRNDPPPQRYEPPPRNDPPPQRYEPPPRNDPPPQRSEPPARSDPPPQRSEPPTRSVPSPPPGWWPRRAVA